MTEGLSDNNITMLTGCYPGEIPDCRDLGDGQPCGNYPAMTGDDCTFCKGHPSRTDRCQVCGGVLEPAPGPIVGYLPCAKCLENKHIADRTRDYYRYLESGAEHV